MLIRKNNDWQTRTEITFSVWTSGTKSNLSPQTDRRKEKNFTLRFFI